MRSSKTRSSQSRKFRLELLEDRAVLSTLTIAHHAAELSSIRATKVLVIQGQAKGAIGFVTDATVNVAMVGPGTTQGLGRINFSGRHYVSTISGQTTTLSITKGTAIIASSRLGTLTISYTGSESIVSASQGNLSLSGTITKAVGPYAGATGTFFATGTQNPKTGRFVLNMTANISV